MENPKIILCYNYLLLGLIALSGFLCIIRLLVSLPFIVSCMPCNVTKQPPYQTLHLFVLHHTFCKSSPSQTIIEHLFCLCCYIVDKTEPNQTHNQTLPLLAHCCMFCKLAQIKIDNSPLKYRPTLFHDVYDWLYAL